MVKIKLIPLSFVVPVVVHLQNADLVLTSPLRFSQHRGLAGLLRPNPLRFGQEGEIATRGGSTALFALSLTWVMRDLPAPVHFLFLRRWVSSCRLKKAHPLNEHVCLTRVTLRLCFTSPTLVQDFTGRVVSPLTPLT